MNKKRLKIVVLAVASAVVVLGVILMIIGAVGSLFGSPGMMAWLDQPISQLKVWHLIAILFITGVATSRWRSLM